jgi:predicted aspartyl protease
MHTFNMVLDTGASRTTFDTTALLMAGCDVRNRVSETDVIETANGIIKVGIFETDSLTTLGRTVANFPVQEYDFLAHGVLSDYDGLLGLDFFENTVLCIDMKNNTIEVN